MTEREKQKTYWAVASATMQLGLREEQKESLGKEATTLVGAASRKCDCGSNLSWVEREKEKVLIPFNRKPSQQ